MAKGYEPERAHPKVTAGQVRTGEAEEGHPTKEVPPRYWTKGHSCSWAVYTNSINL